MKLSYAAVSRKTDIAWRGSVIAIFTTVGGRATGKRSATNVSASGFEPPKFILVKRNVRATDKVYPLHAAVCRIHAFSASLVNEEIGMVNSEIGLGKRCSPMAGKQ